MTIDHGLLNDYRNHLIRFVAPRLRNNNDVDDLVQDAFVRFHSRGSLSEIASPINYLCRIAINLVADRARQRSALINAINIESVPEDLLGIEPSQENGRRFSDLKTAYHAAIADLSPRCREVFQLRRHGGMSTPEVAGHLAITQRMVQKHMAIAMAHLEERLRDFLLDDASNAEDARSGSTVADRGRPRQRGSYETSRSCRSADRLALRRSADELHA